MTTVRSTWTTIAIPQDGLLPATEWADAGSLPIPGGFLMVKNDADNLYIALDVLRDLGNDPGTNDYYWLVIDNDNNGAVTPNRDMMFSPWPGQPNRLGLWLMARPNATWPAANGQVLASTTRTGFGPSLNSATPHRMWEIRLSLSELGITLDPLGSSPSVKFGLRLASSTPAFTFEYPASPLSAFNNFHEILLATQPSRNYPAGTAGIVIGGIGLIPATKINAEGYATIAEPYYLQPDAAVFAGTLNFIGNTATLPSFWSAGAQKYRVLYRNGNTLAEVNAKPWTAIRQSWANYRWTGTTYVWESFGPDSNDMYPLVNPALDYSIKALLFQWDTANAPNNLHQFKLEFFNAAGNPVVLAGTDQIVALRVDNKLPDVKLLNVLHNNSPVSACAIETMSDFNDGVQLVCKAYDPEGHLHSYGLSAEWGAGESASLFSDSFANPANRTTAPIWHGVTTQTIPSAPNEWKPPKTCAYLFRIAATARATNGYSYPIGYVSDFRTLTLIQPNPTATFRAAMVDAEVLPFGFADQGTIAAPGIEPEQLGTETVY
jgi:hypothetical protein